MLTASTLGELLYRAAKEYPTAPAFAYRNEVVTYRDWSAWADQMAALYRARGLRPGDVVALLLPSTPFYLVAYLGAARMGLVTAGINLRYRRQEIGAILRRSGARMLLGVRRAHEGTDFERLVEEVRGGASNLAECVWIEPDEFADTGQLVKQLAPKTAPVPEVRVSPEAPVAIVFTSGTTGLPKGACYQHRNVLALAEIENRRYASGLEPVRKHLAAGTSFAHLGTMARVAVPIGLGALSIVHDRFDPELVLATIEAEKLPHIGAFPTQMIALLDHPARGRYDLRSLRSVLLGGAPVAPELVQRVRDELGAVVSVRYSSTEVGIATASLPSDPPERVCGTVGKPTPGVEVRIVDEANRTLPAGAIGEVVVRSPATMACYWNDPDATAQVIDPEGWVHTGDLGMLDEEGYLHLRGRIKEMYIRGGFNVYPMEIESLLSRHPKVGQVAIVGVPDARLGEIGWAFVVPKKQEDPPTLAELRAFVGEQLASFKRPDGVTILQAMPLTAMFKPDKEALRALWKQAKGT
ncbi:MAG: AMP-binding protein [Candidatus Binatia bacterium]|nr:MAG: AMP-binding protein [Candidatus Binatia bacterium]